MLHCPSRRWPVKPASLPTHRFRSMGVTKAFPTLLIGPAYIKEKNILIISGGDCGASTQSSGVGKSETSVGHPHPCHTVLSLQVAVERLSLPLLCHIQRGGRNVEAEPSPLGCKLHWAEMGRSLPLLECWLPWEEEWFLLGLQVSAFRISLPFPGF